MKRIAKLPLLRTALCIFLVSLLTSVPTFAETYAWFYGTAERGGAASGAIACMGKVDVSAAKDNGNQIKISNASTIPIILRVRVIAEWVQEFPGTAGTPPEVPHMDALFGGNTASWATDGKFLIYTTGNENNKDFGSYGAIPGTEKEIFLPPIVNKPAHYGWNLEIYYIAEALQATQKAYSAAGWGLNNG